jgi:hypothetical protein
MKITEYFQFFIDNPPALIVVTGIVLAVINRPEFIMLALVGFGMQTLWFLFRRRNER